MAVKTLPYGTQAIAIWHSSHCHMAVKPLPYGTQVTAIWQSSHCHMTVEPLPYGTQAIAVWHSSHCHMALKSLPYGTQVTAIWQSSHCHMAVKTLPPSCGTNLSQPLLRLNEKSKKTLHIPFYKTSRLQRYIKYQGDKIWNKIPIQIQNASYSIFKYEFKKYLLKPYI